MGRGHYQRGCGWALLTTGGSVVNSRVDDRFAFILLLGGN